MDKDESISTIQNKIFIYNSLRVMTDFDLAELYGVPTKVLNQAVKRNKDRFPEDFMFIVDKYNLKSQIVTSSYGGRRKPIYLFTEQGVAMLSI